MEAVPEINLDSLVTGWRRIGIEVGKSGQALATRYSCGTLPVQPIKLGHGVAMTPSMIERLKAALA